MVKVGIPAKTAADARQEIVLDFEVEVCYTGKKCACAECMSCRAVLGGSRPERQYRVTE